MRSDLLAIHDKMPLVTPGAGSCAPMNPSPPLLRTARHYIRDAHRSEPAVFRNLC